MPYYVHLTLKEREEISRMLAAGNSIRSIAAALGRAPSTMQREIRKNAKRQSLYRAVEAHRRAIKNLRKARKMRKIDSNLALKKLIFEWLMKRWSPEQIAQHLKRRYPNQKDMNISHESIYTYIYVLARGTLKKSLVLHLRKNHHIRRSRSKERLKSSPIQDLVSIDQRPKEVENRTIPGHWEGDLLVGAMNQSFLGTLVERTTRFTLLVPLKSRNTLEVKDAFAKKVNTLPKELKLSLTYDRGCEMKQHRLFTEETKMKVYFAHPHSPWERGTNENTNGLLRDFFPKGTDFKKYSNEYIEHVQTIFNERPRKILNWRSPAEAFNQLLHL